MTNSSHQFGGSWTEEKLERIRKYLNAYMQIFSTNLRASFFETYYVDAFAGTGYRDVFVGDSRTDISLFSSGSDVESLEADAQFLQKGSARVALEISMPFNKYIFIEKKAEFINDLNQLKKDFPSRDITILHGEANKALQGWLKHINWQSSRAVLFLDPYGMEVDWDTITLIAESKAIDLWILFPLAQAVNRLLTKDRLPNDSWSRKLTRFFGTEDWQTTFYKRIVEQPDLFGDTQSLFKKSTDFDAIGQYFVQRLESVFVSVAKNPLPLFNSRGLPLFLLCFAASNPKGAGTAVKIAQDILGN